jgi:hypothetical protein
MSTFDQIADDAALNKTVESLKKNGISSVVVENGEAAKKKVFELVPQGAEVMTMSSVTLDTIGVSDEVQNSGKYKSVKNELASMSRDTQHREMQRLGAAPEYTVGSVHAVTEDGQVVIASNTGSQLPAYAYASDHVIWVVGTQKITQNLDAAMKRIYDYVLPLESERLKKVYGVPSNVSKLLIISKEINPQRITLIFVKEKLGY